jgi:hypothetical protein
VSSCPVLNQRSRFPRSYLRGSSQGSFGDANPSCPS